MKKSNYDKKWLLTAFLNEKWGFLSKKCQNFQKQEINHKIEKTFRWYMYVEKTLQIFWCFLSKDIFLPLFK